ncbi:beta strand repeat-containing protein [Ralstonia syzygii subsp. celebesensis]|uniref:Putative hemagglutinin-related protein n=2 Tax=Ralstonia syzygii TaxID=28097 RepID=G2ZWW0_9RALS|nr:filamentous hemagglutinin N-terminal domain-containing protein [Ralstonia syzygii]CCA82843.1 putative hemagglutinin-related protein [blood disease bacterium R229]
MRQPVPARARAALEQPRAAAQQQEQHRVPAGTADAVSRRDRARRSFVVRIIVAAVALISWLGPVQVSWQTARQSAATIAQHGAASEGRDSPFTSWRITGRLLVRWGMQQAQAGAITDPTAPIRFTPTLTQTTGQGGGVPVVNITTPNSSGLSYNLLRSLTVDGIGLILNNSLLGCGTLLGGNVTGNANLAASGPASTILTQVTGTDPIRINGTVEVFGAPASVIFAAPAGIYTQGAGFTNTPRVTLATGTPQFFNGNGANVPFDQATAVGFLVGSGRIQIDPAAGSTAGAGIEGTVGAINLIGQTVGVNAPLYAGNQINVIAGNQLVAPVATGTGRAGSDWQVSGTGANAAANSPSAQNGLAIDATAFGAMTAGQIKLISTAQGLGVRAAGDLAANTSNVNIDANGDVRVGNVYGQQNVGIASTGAVSTGGTFNALQDVSVTANGDVTLGGSAQAGRNLTLSSGGSVSGPGSLSATHAVSVSASNSVNLGGALNGATVAVTAQGQDGTGDITLGGSVSSPGTIALNAARDTTVNGSVVSGSDLNLSTQRNLTVHGVVGSTSGKVALTGVTGSVTTTGSVISPGSLTVQAGTDANLGGQVLASGPASVTAQAGSITTSGKVATNGDLALVAAQSVTVGGQAQSAGKTTITASAGSASIDGTLSSGGDATVRAGTDVSVAGALATNGNATVAAAKSVTLTGQAVTGGNLSATAGQTLNVGQLTYVGGDAMLRGASVTVGASGSQANTIHGTLDAAATQGLTLTGSNNAGTIKLAGGTVVNQGATVAAGTSTVSGGAVTNTGTLAGSQVNLSASDLVNRGTIGGQTVNVIATNRFDNAGGLTVGTQALNVTTGALSGNQGGTLFAGDLTGRSPKTGDLTVTVTGSNGSFNNAGGQLLAGNNLTVNTPNQAFDPSGGGTGTLNANGTLTLSAQSISNTGTWNVAGNNVVLNATQGIANSGTIQKAGDLSLSTGGTLANSGQIVGGSNVALSAGTLTNTGTIHADGNLALSGNVRNAGTAEALGNIAVTGSNYDNQGGKTQANGDIRFDLGGTLNNVGSVIGANGNVHIAAQSVINDRTAPVDAGSSVSKVVNDALLNSTIIGSYAPWVYGGSCDSCSAFVAGAPVNATIGDLMRNPDGSIPLVTGSIPAYVGGGDNGASLTYVDAWHLGATPGSGYQSRSLALPTVDRTIVRQADGTAGQIASGGALDITAASLSNQGGIIQASKDVTLNVGSLNNGRSATLVNSVKDAVNAGEFAAFLAQINSIVQSGADGVSRTLMFGQPMSLCSRDDCGAPAPTAAELTLGTAVDGSKVSAPVQSTVTYTLGKAGQILSGGSLSLTGSGDLTNAGDLAAAGKVTITAAGTFTNQGTYVSSVTTTAGCLPGAITCREGGAHVDTLNYQQTPNTVAAGDTLTVNAANIQNLNGTLAAVGNVTLTAAGTVTNRAGAIQSTAGDVSITAPTVVNTTMTPVTLHKSYGNTNPSYAGGCNAGGTYKESQCASDETTASGPAGVISAARDVNLSGTTLTNNGALITGGRNVTVNMAGNVENNSIALNANWYGHWVEETGMFSSDKRHETNGVAVLGNLASGIQAGNALSVTSGGRTVNTGNLLGSTVDLTSASLVNGITSPTQPTPPQVAGQQVISLAPVAAPAGAVPANMPDSTPTVPWQFSPAIVTTPATPNAPANTSVTWHFNAPAAGGTIGTAGSSVNSATYLNPSPATAVLAGVTPASLLSQLPADLRPGGTPFYYDPFTENQKLQQAALAQTGQSSFINGLSYDSQNRLSVTDQEKLILYGNAADYAKAHNIPLGQALTQQQIAQLDKPMLWYVMQQVPDPNCNTVASTACPMVSALVPQLYLPAGYADAITQPAGGMIAGTNVNVNVNGTLRNSGQIVAGDALNVHAGTIDARPNVVNVGTSAYKVEGGWLEVSGTQVQPGGFMSAVNLNITANAINAINEAFIVRNADGTTNREASNALVAQLKANLGLNYTSGTVKDDIHQNFIKEDGPLPGWVGAVVAVAISIVTAGAGAGLMAIMMAGMLSSVASQALTTGKVNLGQALEAGAISVVTAGLTQGALSALNLSSVGASTIGNNIATGNWAAAQSSLGSYFEAAVVRSAISASVNTIAYGGSFGQSFANGLVQSAAALGASAIGAEIPGIGKEGASPSSILANVTGHALLGCAAASLSGSECAGGAVGGAISALVANPIASAVTDGQGHLSDAQLAAITALSMLAGSGMAAVLGHDALSAATAVQNEVLNNTCGSEDPNGCGKKYAAAGAAAGGMITATASVGVDVVTGGLNILATPAEVAAGSALGGVIGGVYGSFLDRLAGGGPLFSSGDEVDTTATGDGANDKTGDDKPSLLDAKGETHVLDGDGPSKGGGHRAGTGKSGKSEFPTNWSDEKLKGEISDVATDPSSVRTPQSNGRIKVQGTRDGIDITVIVESPSRGGRIVTGFPTNTPRNP